MIETKLKEKKIFTPPLTELEDVLSWGASCNLKLSGCKQSEPAAAARLRRVYRYPYKCSITYLTALFYFLDINPFF